MQTNFFKTKSESKLKRILVILALTPAVLGAQSAARDGAQASTSADGPVALEPYVVTAARTTQPLVVETDPRAPAQPVPASDGADILKNIAGFSVVRKGGTDGDPVLRGLAGSRLGILLDGENILGGCGSRMDPPTAYVFPTAYDRVTVIKGPQTVLHGPGNSAGVVLFERDLKRFHSPAADVTASLTGASFGRIDGLGDVLAGNALVQARATATWTRADNYEDGNGNAVHSAYDRWSANASLAWTPDARTSVELTGARSNGEAAYADRMMDGAKFDRVNYGLRFRRDGLTPFITRVEARWYYNHVDHVMDNYSLRPFTPSMMMPNPSASNPERVTAGGLAQVTLAPAGSFTVTIGADTQRNKHTSRSTMNEPMMPYENMAREKNAAFNQYGLFAEGTWAFAPASRLIAGTRLDAWKAEDFRQTVSVSMMSTVPNPTADQARRDNLASGFARYERDLGEGKQPLTLFAGIGAVQRFPDYWELFSNESAASVSAFDTKSETTVQLDLGALWRRGSVQASASIFAADISDYILVQSNVAKPSGMMGTRPATITRNVDASTFGGEVSFAWRITEHWKLDASAAYLRGENDTDALPLAQMPPFEGRVALAYATVNWSAGGLFRAVAAQNRVAANQGNIAGQDIGASPGFAVVSLNASRRFGKYVRLSAGVDNLFDKAYAEHISRAGSMISGFVQTTRVNEPGRNFWAKLDVSF